MVIVRLLVFLVLVTVGAALAMFLFTRNRHYLTFAWQVFKFALIFGLAAAVLMALERLVLVAL
ncbi:MAG: hypothetical protein AB1513_08620 [Pseudomonadota bacterium]